MPLWLRFGSSHPDAVKLSDELCLSGSPAVTVRTISRSALLLLRTVLARSPTLAWYRSSNSPIVEYPDLLLSFSAVSHCPLRIGSMISLARAFAATEFFGCETTRNCCICMDFHR